MIGEISNVGRQDRPCLFVTDHIFFSKLNWDALYLGV